MAYDPQREDYERLGLRFARSLDKQGTPGSARDFFSFGRRFAMDRDSLPQSDSDRAFYLVTQATRLIDYELPFADDQHAEQLIAQGRVLLAEALSLDPHCHDARRMLASADNGSFELFLDYLRENADEVRAHCEQGRDEARTRGTDERARLAADLAMRPYLRWIASQAEQALICGRNREAIAHAELALSLDPRDAADVRFTAALAYAKLEDDEGLRALREQARESGRKRPADDAWFQLAQLALAFKRHDLPAARACLEGLLKTYPHAAETLIRQTELPDGVFSRLAVKPYSEDELILAVSEATVLLQEGFDPQGRGVLSTWVIQETAHLKPQAMLAVMAQQTNATEERPR